MVHCGNQLAGRFANSLTVTDIYSGWTENYASLSKKAPFIVEGIRDIRRRLPFPLKMFACDNGSEFLNHEFIKYMQKPDEGYVRLVRRRAYKKNDNAHVEQKNDTHVRQIFGYRRISSEILVGLMNDIYRELWNPLLNHFHPVLKLKKKIRIGGRVRKIYDKPKTPHQRLIDCKDLSPARKAKLEMEHELLNPFDLEKRLSKKLEFFFKQLNLDPASKEDNEWENAS